jgi:hypothetical protein
LSSQYERQIEILREDNRSLADRAKLFEQHVQTKENELRSMREAAAQAASDHAIALQQSKDEINRLNSICEELQHKVNSQDTEISALSASHVANGEEHEPSPTNPLDEVVHSLKEENARLLKKARMYEDKCANEESRGRELEARILEQERIHDEKLRILQEDFSKTKIQLDESRSQDKQNFQREVSILNDRIEQDRKQFDLESSTFQTTLHDAEQRFQRQQEEWRVDFSSKEQEIVSMKQTWKDEKNTLDNSLQQLTQQYQQQLHDKDQQYQAQLTQLQEAQNLSQAENDEKERMNQLTSLQVECTTMKQQLEQKESALRDLRAELKLAKETQQAVMTQLAQSQEENARKTSQIEDLSAKVQALTDKMRELVQRHSEMKNKASSMQQEKDSEVVKLQLKFDAQREQFEEQRSKMQELSDRYSALQKLWSESQRDQQRWEDERHQVESRTQELQMQMEEKEAALLAVEVSKRRIEEDLGELLRESERKYSLLSDEFRKLQENSGHNAEQAQALENYKRRSQLALKKANASAASLQDENTQLQNQLQGLHREIELLRQSEESLRQTLLTTEQEMMKRTSESTTFHNEDASLRQEIQNLSAELLKLQAQQQSQVVQPPVATTDISQPSTVHVQSNEIPISSSIPTESNPPMIVKEGVQAQAADENNEALEIVRDSALDDYFTTAVLPSPSSSSSSQITSMHFHHPPLPQHSHQQVLSTSSSTSSGFVLVDELQQQVHSLQRLVAQRSMEFDETNHLLRKEKEEKEKLSQRCEELAAFLSRARKMTASADLQSSRGGGDGSQSGSKPSGLGNAGPNAVGVNLDYLKQVVYKFVTASEHSERQRLLPVLCALLSFTAKEKQQAVSALEQWQTSVDSVLGMTATNVEVLSSAFSWLGGLTGGSSEGSSSSNINNNSKK